MGPINESYDFLAENVDNSIMIGEFRLPEDTEKLDGIITVRNAEYTYYIEAKNLKEKVTDSHVTETYKTVPARRIKGHRQIIFFVARHAELDYESLKPSFEGSSIFFQCCKLENGQVRFTTSDKITQGPIARSIETIVIVLSLETFYGVYDISTDATGERRLAPPADNDEAGCSINSRKSARTKWTGSVLIC